MGKVLLLLVVLGLGYLLGFQHGSKEREIQVRLVDAGTVFNAPQAAPVVNPEPGPTVAENPIDPIDPIIPISNPTRKIPTTELALAERAITEPFQQPARSEPAKDPWVRLLELVESNRYKEALALIRGTDFGDSGKDVLAIRAKVATHLAMELMQGHQRQAAKELITQERNLQPGDLSLLKAEVEWYKEVGRRPEAILSVNQVLQLSLPEEDRDQALAWRHDLMLGHLKALSESEQWREVSDFLARDPAGGDDRYYRYQLWAARAHTELFEFSQARSALEMASFDVDLLDEVKVASAYIDRLQASRHERVSLNGRAGVVRPTKTDLPPATSDLPPEDGWVELKAKWVQGSVIVTLVVGKASLPMLIDTGASTTSLDLRWQNRLAGEVAKELGERTFHTANGMTVGTVVQLGGVQLGPYEVKSVEVAFMKGLKVESRYVGLLGMNVLRYFDFKFDEVAGVVRLREKL